ncbi:MAG: TonB-dependent receptor [Capnocytophaga sp.]|nr:TonB-dependent receptor [Capnocytophaga sp.]
MKYYLFFIIFYTSICYSQNIITGKVIDEHKKPLFGVNVFLQGTIDGTSTDENGLFSFQTKNNGNAVLVCKHITMNDVEIPIHIPLKNKNLTIKMQEKESELEEVILTAGSFGLSDKKQATVLNTMDVETTAGTDGDITGALLTLPGTQQVGESGLLFVRGGSGSETKITIDGLDIPNPYFSGIPDVAQRNRFSPHLFKGIVFNTGGYTAQYGGALSSILSLETKDLPNKPSMVIALIPYGGQIGYDYLNKKETFSVGFDVGYSNFKPYYQLISQNIDWIKAPESTMITGNFRQKFKNNGILKWYGYGNILQQSVYQENVEHKELKYPYLSKNNNAISLLTYTQTIKDKWQLYVGYGFNYNKDDIQSYSSDNEAITSQHQFRFSISGKLNSWLKLHTGTEAFFFFADNKNRLSNVNHSLSNYETAVWATTDFRLHRNIILQTGLRTEYDKTLSQATILPRFSLAYRTGKHHQLNLSAGEYAQKPNYIYLLNSDNLSYLKSKHYIANFQYSNEKRIFRLEAYYKNYNSLLTGNDLGFSENVTFWQQPIFNSGYGYAKGIDVFWRDAKSIKGLDYWLSYTFLNSERKYLAFPYSTSPTFVSPHTGHIVGKYFFEKLGLFVGGSYSVASGRAYYNPNSDFLTDKTPIYQNVNFNIALLRKWGRTFNTFVFAINNIAGNKQIFNYKYSSDGQYRAEVTLPYTRSFMLGWFISIGQDRSNEILEQLP